MLTMQSTAPNAALEELRYPVLLFRDDYLYQAYSPIDLQIHSRRPPDRMQVKWQRIADSNCNLFEIDSWQKTHIPIHWKSIPALMLGSRSYVPVISSSQKLDFPALRTILEEFVVEGRMYMGSYDDEAQFRNDIHKCQSVAELFRFLRRFP